MFTINQIILYLIGVMVYGWIVAIPYIASASSRNRPLFPSHPSQKATIFGIPVDIFLVLLPFAPVGLPAIFLLHLYREGKETSQPKRHRCGMENLAYLLIFMWPSLIPLYLIPTLTANDHQRTYS